jgi:lambda repressor-like predicted transcriptional regulator
MTSPPRRPHGIFLNAQLISSLLPPGQSLSTTATEFGIDRRTLRRVLKGLSVEGESARTIANHLGVDLESILAVEPYAGPSTGHIIASFDDIVAKNIDIVNSAREHLICFGSRSRDRQYLLAIEEACKKNNGLIYQRILFFKPFHSELQEHLLRILDIRSTRDRRHGYQTLFICVCDDVLMQPELSICMNEKRANMILPSINMPGKYDTSLSVDDARAIKTWSILANDLCRNCKTLDTKEDVRQLGIIADGERYV